VQPGELLQLIVISVGETGALKTFLELRGKEDDVTGPLRAAGIKPGRV
jgi:hypothetical protein